MAVMTKPEDRKKVIGLYMEKSVIDEIDKQASAENRTRTNFLTQLIKKALGLTKGGN